MQEDFHYYATYCAAYLAGHTHEESLTIAYSAQFVDCCSRSLLDGVKGPDAAATTQAQGNWQTQGPTCSVCRISPESGLLIIFCLLS